MAGLKRETDINLSYLLRRPKEKAMRLSQHALLLFLLSLIKICTFALHVQTAVISERPTSKNVPDFLLSDFVEV